MYANGTAITLSSLVMFIQQAVYVLWGIAGLAIVGGLAYAGFLMVTAAGDEAKFKKGKTMLGQVIIGAAVILGIGLIVNTIANFAVNPTNILR